MDKIQMYVDSLIGAIKEGEAYQRYTNCEEELKKQPELRKKIDEFRTAVYRFNNDSNRDLYAESDHFEEQYEGLRKNPLVNEYLEAELDVCKLLQKVSTRIQCGVDIKIPQV